jgi:hypothetical protein
LNNVGDFRNLQSGAFWYGTEYALDPSLVWYFNSAFGIQTYNSNKTGVNFAIAVRPGDVLSVAAVPLPTSFPLTLAGLGVLGLVARRRKTVSI